MMRLYCKQCNHQVTNRPLQKIAVESLKFREEEQLVPYGRFANAEEAEMQGRLRLSFLVREGELNVILTSHGKRLYGCCGYSNMEDFTIVCGKCSYEMGIIITECSWEYYVGICGDRVSKFPLW